MAQAVAAYGQAGREAGRQAAETLGIILVLAILWQGAYEYIGPTGMSPPIQTAIAAYGLLASADFWPNVYATGRALLGALALEFTFGLLIGLALGMNRLAGDIFEPIFISIYSIPKIMFYPVIMMVFGIGIAAEVAFGVFQGVVPIVLFTSSAVRNIRPVYFKTARIMRLNPVQRLWNIALPAALPEIFTGLRIGFSGSVIGVLLSEMFGARNGLGFMLVNAMAMNVVNVIMSLTFLLVIFAAAVNAILLYIDSRLHRRVK